MGSLHNTMAKIKISFELSEKNYHGAYSQHIKHRYKWWMRIRLLFCISVILIGAYLISFTSEKGIGYFSVVFGSFGIMRPMIWQMWHERNVRKNPAFGTIINYTFSKKKLTISGEQGEYSVPLTQIYEFVYARKGLLIYLNKKRYLWIPKEFIKDAIPSIISS